MAHVRGLHETGGLGAVRILRSKAQPNKLTNKLARLDHQRGLLERQLAVWTEKQQVTRHRLSLVEKQMAEIGRSVRQLVAPRRKANGRQWPRAVATGGEVDGTAGAPLPKDVNLEY